MKQLSTDMSVKEFTDALEKEMGFGFIFKSNEDVNTLLKLYINLIEYFSFHRVQWLNLVKE